MSIPGHTAILIDTSNKIPAEDTLRAFLKIDALARDTLVDLQRLSIHRLPNTPGDLPVRSDGSWCIPKDGDDANLLYENPDYVEVEFRQFLATLAHIFRELVSREEADQSPIVETIAHLVQRDHRLNSIVLVSDMLQNTLLWNHYTMEGDSLGIQSECRRITQPGRLETVYVYHIDRGVSAVGAAGWPDEWWSRCLGTVQTVLLNH